MIAPDSKKKIFVHVAEGALATGMVFICFLLFTDFLEIIFPTNLTSDLTTAAATDKSVLEHPHWRRLLLAKGNHASDLAANQTPAATVVKTRNSVKCKRSTAVSWEKSPRGMRLYTHDALQTLANASALIEFDGHNRTRLGEKTLIIIKQMEQDLIFNDKRIFVLLIEGALRTQLSSSEINGAYMNLETPQATLRMHGMTEARVVAGSDNASTLSVYQGAVEVATQLERRTVRANQAIRIPLGKPLETFIDLPQPLEQLSPKDMFQHFTKEHSGTIRFSWQRQTDATGYHFMLARDSNFKDLVVDKSIQKNHFARQYFSPGTYYWRVSMLAGDIEGYYSKTHRLHVYRQTPPPGLLADYPPEKVYYRNVAPMIGFAWRKSPGSPTYYWQMARDEDFMEIVGKKTLKSNRVNKETLTEGVYYWRVGLRDAPNQPISFSAARRLEIIRDSVPPPLMVELPTTARCDQGYAISGRTEPGAKVFIGGYEAKVSPSGDFKYTMRLNKGKNVIAVAATDAANNVTSKSPIVICK
ncbi:MAG: FecR domain-containing protein [Desulfobacteraceae bacterium]|jgi:hypothetical protein